MVWTVLDAVGEVDLSAFCCAYRADGDGRRAKGASDSPSQGDRNEAAVAALTPDSGPRWERPPFAFGRNAGQPHNAVVLALRLDGSPHVDSLVEKLDVHRHRRVHGPIIACGRECRSEAATALAFAVLVDQPVKRESGRADPRPVPWAEAPKSRPALATIAWRQERKPAVHTQGVRPADR